MSHVVAALPCCCTGTPCEACCDDTTTEFTVGWSGSFVLQFETCDCVPDVPNFICPCYGLVSLMAGQIGRGRIVNTPPSPLDPCGSCVIELEPIALMGSGYYFCPCACVWEDPPFSGQFYSCQDIAPEYCGGFTPIAGNGFLTPEQPGGLCGVQFVPVVILVADTSPQSSTYGHWYILVPFGFKGMIRDGCIVDEPVMTYCHPGTGDPPHASVKTPGYDGVIYKGPALTFCPDGRVDVRSLRGLYSPLNHVVLQKPNELLTWNPGFITIG